MHCIQNNSEQRHGNAYKEQIRHLPYCLLQSRQENLEIPWHEGPTGGIFQIHGTGKDWITSREYLYSRTRSSNSEFEEYCSSTSKRRIPIVCEIKFFSEHLQSLQIYFGLGLIILWTKQISDRYFIERDRAVQKCEDAEATIPSHS